LGYVGEQVCSEASVSEYPPMYFGLIHRLNGEDEYGYAISLERAHEIAVEMRDYILNVSAFKDDNEKQWRAFIKQHPRDKAAIFMDEFLR
jgi:hypothetical protein